MKRILGSALAVLVAAACILSVGCGDSKVDNKQPKLSGPPDPRIKGPATPGGGGDAKGGKPGAATLP